MTQIKIEITNIVWENDEDGSIAYDHGTARCFEIELSDEDCESSESIDEAIRSHVELETGKILESWYLYEFSPIDDLSFFDEDEEANS